MWLLLRFQATNGQWLASAIDRMIAAEPTTPPVWSSINLLVQVVFFVCGLVQAECVLVMAEAAVPPASGPETRSAKFLAKLLAMPVSREAERRIRGQVVRGRALGVLGLSCVLLGSRLSMYRYLLESFWGQHDSDACVHRCVMSWEYANGLLSLVATLPALQSFILGTYFFLNIPSAIVCDDIERRAAWVQRLSRRKNRGPECWDVVMGHVQKANESTTKLTALVMAPIHAIVGSSAMVIMALFVLGNVLPRPANAELYLGLSSWRQPVAGTLLYACFVWWLLSAGARASDSCDLLFGAVSSLRAVEMEKPANLIRVEGIRDYCLGLNRGQGLGFIMGGTRMTTGKLPSLILRGVATLIAMCVLGSAARDKTTAGLGNATDAMEPDSAASQLPISGDALVKSLAVVYVLGAAAMGAWLLLLFRAPQRSMEELEQAQYTMLGL